MTSVRILFLLARDLCLAAGLLVAGISLQAAAPHRTVKVAVFPHPPAIFVDEADGVVKGFYVDMLREVAAREHWELQFVPGTWAEGLERARKGEVDLLTSVAFTPERATFLDYGKEPSFTVWSLLYAHPKAGIQSILDLKDRSVAVMRNDANGENFRKLSTQFGIQITFLEMGTFVDVMKAVESRRVDAGVTPNTFGYFSEPNYRVVRTPVVVNPFPIFFAVGKDKNADLLPALDRFLAEDRGNPRSRHAQIVDRWLNRSSGGLSPWVMRGFFLGLALLGLSFGAVVVFRRQVRRATHEIRSLNQDLQRELEARRAREERILNVAQGVSAAIGEAFFQDLVKFLASATGADLAYIGEVHGERVRVIAAWADGALIPPFDFAKGDTPCEEVLKGDVCVVASGLQDRFPRDLYLIGSGYNSYVGTPLRDEANQVNGLMAILKRGELVDPDEVVGLLQIFTVRAMSEVERRRREAALLEAKALTDAVVEAVPLMIFLKEATDLKFVVFNRAGEELLGHDRKNLLGKNNLELFPPEQAAHFMAMDRKVLEGGVGVLDIPEETISTAKKGQRVLHTRKLGILAADGTTKYLLGISEDITERKQAEAKLLESERILREVIEATLAGFWDWNLADNTEYLSPTFKRMFGYEDHEMENSPESWQKIIFPEDLPGVLEVFDRHIKSHGREPFYSEIRYRHRDGSTVWVICAGRVIEWAENAVPVRMVGCHVDITKLKQTEEEKAHLQAQLQQSQKMESLGTLAGGVAHDMNNVLGAILGLASAHIGSQPYGSPLHQALDTICKATERGGKMVKSLLNFARQSPAESQKLDMNALLREEVSLLERTTLAKVRLHLDLAAELRPIQGDANALTHAFMNLFVNAVDAMPANGTLTLHTRNVDKDLIEVVVEDNGMGMPREVLEKAMEPFFTTKETGKGTGLGLSMVFSTVKAHRGQITIESEPGHGTRVTLRFPACEVDTPNQATAPAVVDAPLSPQGAKKVLLVDDDDLVRSSVQAILEVLGHTAVTPALSGEEALAKLEAGFEPDLIILDMNMPGMGGIGALPRLRALRPEVPILLATGRVDQTALALASAHSGVTLLPKPFGLRELRKHLECIGLE